MTKIQNWILVVFLSLSMNVWAEVFECKDSQGHIKYQDSECNKTNDERVINLPSGNFVTPYHHKEDDSQFKSYNSASITDNYQRGLDAYQHQNYQEAFLFLLSAANLNHPESQNMLGGMYLEGQGVPKSGQIACSWFKRSADLGYVTAQTNLAYMYHQGLGCTKDVFLAKEWYQKAIAKGDVRAKKLLADLEAQALLNVEAMKAEAKKYEEVYSKINNPPSPAVEKISAVSGTSWLILLLFLFFIVLSRINRTNEERLINGNKEFEELKKHIQIPYKLEYYIPVKYHLVFSGMYLFAGLNALYLMMASKKGFTFLGMVGILLLLASIFSIALNLRIKKRSIAFTQAYVQLPVLIFFKQKLMSVAYKDIESIWYSRFLHKIWIKTKQGGFVLSPRGFENLSYYLLFQYLLELGIKKQLPQENQNGQSQANKHPKQKVNENKFAQQSVPQPSKKYSQKAEYTKTESPLESESSSQNQSKEESANDRQFKSLLRAIEEQKKTDPLIGAKVGAKEIIQQLLHLLRDNKGVHSESMLAVLGTLAGYACQASVRQEFVANQKLPEEGIFVVATGTDGKNYYFGDYLNKPLAENQYSVWSLAAGAAQSLGVSQLLDVYEIFEYVTTTVGTETFGVPRIPLERKPSDLPKDYLK